MNNKQKLEQTIDKVKEVRDKHAIVLRRKLNQTENYLEQNRLEQKLLALEELEFLTKKPYFVFCSLNYGSYRPYIRNGKKRIRAVSICFLVTLYQQELEATFPKENIQIPYDLRGFWKMQQAVELLEDFVKFQNKAQEVLLWEYRRLKKQRKAKAAEYFKILEEFVAMGTVSYGLKKKIIYHDVEFVINTKNVKLDVVPLCKILTKYYANVVTRINHYLKSSASKAEEEKLERIKENFTEFMEKYFVNIA